MNKVISYSLFGSNPRYLKPILLTARDVTCILPGWSIWVYHDCTVPKVIIEELIELGVKVINISGTEYYTWAPKFWRFLPVLKENVDTVLFRDSDSIITKREVILVNLWMGSNFKAQIIRDHQLHIAPIMAGMFGLKKDLFPFFAGQLHCNEDFKIKRDYSSDQEFLAKKIYSAIKFDSLVHTSFFSYPGENCIRIQKCRNTNFIGAVYNSLEENYRFEYDFMIGIPFWLARAFQFKTRPVLYVSKYLEYLKGLLSKSHLIKEEVYFD